MPEFPSIPVEKYTIADRKITVMRADKVPQPPLAPYLKMIELKTYMKLLADRGTKLVAYYAVPESEWVTAIPPLAKSAGMDSLIGISKTKKMPWYVSQINESNLLLLSPNMYKVNYSRTKKHVESLGGIIAPMGLECPEVVDGLTAYLDANPIRSRDVLVVPTGSGVALSGILNHLRGKGQVISVCTRPTKSVQAVVSKYVSYTNVEYYFRDAHQKAADGPFPMHSYWDMNAYQWMLENLPDLQGSIGFMNLGSGVRK